MKRSSVQFAALVGPLTLVAALLTVLSSAAATIFAVGPGKVDIDVIWTGSDDGLVHVTRDGGERWTNVTPPDMPEFGRVSLIDASAFDAGKAYVSARLPLLDDFRPHVWRTEDYGETWTRIVDGIRDDAYANSVREDPNREGLLYAGTNHGVYVTFDDGGWWQELNPGLPLGRLEGSLRELEGFLEGQLEGGMGDPRQLGMDATPVVGSRLSKVGVVARLTLVVVGEKGLRATKSSCYSVLSA